ncbi:ankyrin repeat domain-containing protein 17 isoform X5 [Strongylocentrotus purpuratus]|uniref:K Homology domain-containing protein n=1 Tax=Strongylocentrotus purpuratus TaxID=7668 RepID=A0A7M7NGZ1_STRPU|nr:ankyrin repeat domain-containing protein 17 isoform X5 [Strongylocentrotus purpuratus]
MQNGGQKKATGSRKESKTVSKVNVPNTHANANSAIEKAQLLASLQQDLMAELSGSEEGEVSEVESFILDQEELESGPTIEIANKLLRLDSQGHPDLRAVDPDTLEAFLDAAGIDKLGGPFDGKIEAYDPEILGRLTSSVSSALDQAEAALYGIKENTVLPGQHGDGLQVAGVAGAAASSADPVAARRGDDDKMIQETNEEGESLLSLACSGGYFELAHVLLKMNANVEDRGSKGDCTPLMEAASAGHVDIVKLLLEYGADANAQSSAGNTPLMYACNGGHEEIVKILLDQGANIEDHNENGHTPLMEAASSGHVNIAKILLEKGAGINTHSNEFKESALTLACYKGHLEMVKFLLEAGADHEHKTDEMHTALMEASMDGHVEVARLLLDHGAQVNMPADSFESPLTLAACGGHVKLASLLIERGANIEEVNDEGYTPLMEAAREGHEEMVALLLAQGANINAQTEETQETALTLACCGGFLEVAKFLIEVGADIELGCSTPLMEAAQEGHVDLVKFLLSKGAIVHAQTATGDTALTYACENGHTDVADVLLANGADLEHESEGGRTPLMKAARAGHLCTVQYLISKGADVNKATTNNDHTVLSLACAGGHLKVVELLLAHNADPSHKLKDNSTCLIESAKGGHSDVMVLVLEYPTNMIAHPEGMATPPTPDQGEVSRVPTQALPIVVPPQEPDKHPEEAHLVELGGSSLLGHGQQQNPDVPSSSTPDEALYQRMAGSSTVATTSTSANAITTPAGAPSSLESMDATGIFNTTIPSSFSPTNIVTSASLPDTAISKLDAAAISPAGVVGNAKGHQRTAEEQILEKQQIYAELQKVERELQQRMEVQKVFSVGLPGQGLDEAESSKLTLPVSLPAGVTVPSSTVGTSQTGVSSVVNSAAGVDPPDSSLIAGVPDSNSNQSGNQKQSAVQVPPHLQPLPPSVSDGEESGDNEDDLALDTRDIRIVSSVSSQHEDKGSGEDAADVLGTGVRHEPLGCESQSPPSASVAPPAYESYNQSSNCNCGPTVPAPAASSYIPALSSPLAGIPGHTPLPPASTSVPSPLPDVHTLLKESSGTQVDSSSLAAAGIGHAVLNGGAVQITPSANNITGMSGAMVMPHGYREVHRDSDKRPLESKKPPPQTQSVGTQCDRSSIPHHHQAVPTPLLLTTGGAGVGGLGTGVATTTTALVPSPASPGSYDQAHFAPHPPVEIDAQTESNHDTALTIACAGGHDDLVQMLLEKNANIEHRDKKGFTPLILAATAGHYKTVQILLNHNADIEAQSERTKDTPLSLACSGGRYEVVELLLSHNANKEHRNVSDYTPLSLAASGGYVNIIKLLLRYGAEINSRTGSKLGISPLMLAAMNGHTAAVKLLLDMGSDINAQIETNRNTALTLACFQGRTEVVSLLVDRKANVEHRAKTGLTPLMEAASGGYADVGRVLISKGADVNAPPVPSSRDTALTIAADKGHYRFVELLLQHKAAVDVKNKKGQSSLWLACNGGHFDVVQLLVHAGADIDSQDNRKVSCLMAAFRKGHVKVVRWMVKHVNQFPSDTDCMRYIATISDREVLKKCQQCMEIIVVAKERQAAEANKHANILLEQLESEKTREESRKMAAAKRREKKKKKRKEKQQKGGPNNSSPEPEQDDEEEDEEDDSLGRETSESYEIEDLVPLDPPSATTTTTIGKVRTKDTTTTTTARSNGQSATATTTTTTTTTTVSKKNKNNQSNIITATSQGGGSGGGSNAVVTATTTAATTHTTTAAMSTTSSHRSSASSSNVINQTNSKAALPPNIKTKSASAKEHANNKVNQSRSNNSASSKEERQNNKNRVNMNGDVKDGGKEGAKEGGRHEEKIREEKKKKRMSMKEKGQNHTISKHDDQNSTGLDGGGKKSVGPGGDMGSPNMKGSSITAASPKRGQKREEGWKEVVRRSKKVTVPANAISRLIGRGGCNINAIRDATGAHIDVDRQNKGNERTINIKGSADATRQAHHLISALIKDPDEDLSKLVAKIKKSVAPATIPITMFTATQAPSSSSSTTTSSSSQAGSKSSVQTGTTAAKQAPKMNQSSTANHQPPASKQNSLQPGHQQLTQSHSAPANSQYPNQMPGVIRLPKGVQQHQMAALAQQWGRQPIRQPAPTTMAAPSRVPDPSQHHQPPQQVHQQGRGPISVNVAPPVGSAPQQASAKSPRNGVARQLFTQPAGKAVTNTVSSNRPIQSVAVSGSGGVMTSSAPTPVGAMPVSVSAQSNINASTFASKISESRSGQQLHMPRMMMPSQSQGMGEQVGSGMLPQQPDGNRSAPVSTATGGFNFLSHMNQGRSQNPANAFGWSSLAPGGTLKEEGTGEEGGFPNSEEAKAPGYKRLSTGSMPVGGGDAGLLSTVNNLQGNPPNFNPIHYMHAQHPPPPHPHAPPNPHPHSQPHLNAHPHQHPHAHPIERPDVVSASMPHANLSHFSPITNPPAPSPTPPNANASPGTSPRSGTTSPSTSAAAQDRKLPRPIGTERRGQQTHRRTPVGFADLPFTSAGSIWAHQAGEGNCWPNASISMDDMVVNTPANPIQRPIGRPESYHGQPMNVPVGMSYQREMSDQQPHPGGLPPTNHQPHPGSLPPPQAMPYTAPPSMGNGVWTPAISATDNMDNNQGWRMWNQPSM